MKQFAKDAFSAAYERGLKRLNRFNAICKSMETWLEPANPQINEKSSQCYAEITQGENEPEDIFLNCICDENICHLRGADIEFIDRQSLWLLLNELLINEEYYMEYDNETPVIFDCGVNIGLAVYYFKTRYPNAKIVGFEPWETAFHIAQRNIERNHWNNVSLFPYALSDVDGEAKFNIPLGNTLGGTLTDRCFENNDKSVNSVTIMSKRLGEFIEGPIDFLKMDIEGIEKKVLYSIRERLPQVKFLFCEYHYGQTLADNSLAEITMLLEQCGFEYFIDTSVAYQKQTKRRPMKYAGHKISMVIYAKNRTDIRFSSPPETT